MTPEQLTTFRHLLAMNRQPEHRGQQYAHPRGWNDALDWVEKALRSVLGEAAKAQEQGEKHGTETI